MIEVKQRTKDKKLPKKFSGGIYMAIRDLKKAEKDPGTVINMESWVTRQRKGKPCEVCFAGAVMVGSLGVELPNRASRATPGAFADPTLHKLMALNYLRTGRLEGAYEFYTGRSSTDIPMKVYEALGIRKRSRFLAKPYETDPVGFKKQMGHIAKALKEAGL